MKRALGAYSVRKGGIKFKDLDSESRRAYNSWRDQRHRCRSSNLKSSKHYFAKGIQVKYSSAEFVEWWVSEQNRLKLENPTVGRIDHSGHYEFGNIELQERNYNCVVEPRSRGVLTGAHLSRAVLAIKDGKIKRFKSVTHAARFFKCSRIPIQQRLKNSAQSLYKGYDFIFEGSK